MATKKKVDYQKLAMSRALPAFVGGAAASMVNAKVMPMIADKLPEAIRPYTYLAPMFIGLAMLDGSEEMQFAGAAMIGASGAAFAQQMGVGDDVLAAELDEYFDDVEISDDYSDDDDDDDDEIYGSDDDDDDDDDYED